jgi:hypothetical protein
MKIATVFGYCLIVLTFGFGNLNLSYATPTTHIWAPSTDVQPYGVVHMTSDVYVPAEKDATGTRPNTIINLGLTTGILPFDKLNAEVGFDYKAGYGDLDDYPMYFNGKVGTPENTFGDFFPALASGIYDVGTKYNKTDYNIVYGEAAKTLSSGPSPKVYPAPRKCQRLFPKLIN